MFVGREMAEEGQAGLDLVPKRFRDPQAIAPAAAPPVKKRAHHVRCRVLSQMPEKIRPMPAA
jgi:hypothetical protein